jgi:hypothetical protein
LAAWRVRCSTVRVARSAMSLRGRRAAIPRDRFDDAPALLRALHRAVGAEDVVALHTGGGDGVPADATVPPRNPYKGLRAFAEADAGDFFGRDAFVARLVARLREDEPTARFLAVVGPSGSGKSSVVRAGLVPALRAGALPGSSAWYVAQLLPGGDPFDELATALQPLAVDPPHDLAGLLAADDADLLATLDVVLPDDHVLLVVGQFEELWTQVADDEVRRRFWRCSCRRSPIRAPGSGWS